jgi:hypothetical protein
MVKVGAQPKDARGSGRMRLARDQAGASGWSVWGSPRWRRPGAAHQGEIESDRRFRNTPAVRTPGAIDTRPGTVYPSLDWHRPVDRLSELGPAKLP